MKDDGSNVDDKDNYNDMDQVFINGQLYNVTVDYYYYYYYYDGNKS